MSQPPPTPPNRPTATRPTPRSKTKRAERIRKLKLQAATSTTAIFLAAWVGLAVAGTDPTTTASTDASPATSVETASGSAASAAGSATSSPTTDDDTGTAEADTDDWSYDAGTTEESTWSTDRRAATAPSAVTTGQS